MCMVCFFLFRLCLIFDMCSFAIGYGYVYVLCAEFRTSYVWTLEPLAAAEAARCIRAAAVRILIGPRKGPFKGWGLKEPFKEWGQKTSPRDGAETFH